ncbi:hypothetical protein HanPSC8_Chr16g0724401 [Helianthus annuus]|nr:hypothetical protein HanPSC8_Chr16g0724401 [Helianthus annuus]
MDWNFPAKTTFSLLLEQYLIKAGTRKCFQDVLLLKWSSSSHVPRVK